MKIDAGSRRAVVEGKEYSPLFAGLQVIGGQWSGGTSERYPHRFTTSLVTVSDGWVRSGITVGSRSKYLSAWKRFGRGELLLLVDFDGASHVPFIGDTLIEIGQNVEAAMRLAGWLAGKVRYPTGQ